MWEDLKGELKAWTLGIGCMNRLRPRISKENWRDAKAEDSWEPADNGKRISKENWRRQWTHTTITIKTQRGSQRRIEGIQINAFVPYSLNLTIEDLKGELKAGFLNPILRYVITTEDLKGELKECLGLGRFASPLWREDLKGELKDIRNPNRGSPVHDACMRISKENWRKTPASAALPTPWGGWERISKENWRCIEIPDSLADWLREVWGSQRRIEGRSSCRRSLCCHSLRISKENWRSMPLPLAGKAKSVWRRISKENWRIVATAGDNPSPSSGRKIFSLCRLP